MKTEAVCVLLCVLSIISWIGATPIGNNESREEKGISDRDRRSFNGAFIEQTMNHYVNGAPAESNNEFSDRSPPFNLVGAQIIQNSNHYEPSNEDIRGAVINQTSNEYRVGRYGGTIQGATITQNGNKYGVERPFEDPRWNAVPYYPKAKTNEYATDRNSQTENYDKVKSSNSKDLPTASTSEVKANEVEVLQQKNQLPQSNNVNNLHNQIKNHEHESDRIQSANAIENMSSTSGAQSTQSVTANHLRGNYNYQEMGSGQSQAPQGTQYLPSQSGFLPTKFDNVNYSNINYNYNRQGFGQMTPQGIQDIPFQSGFLPNKFENVNYPNINYNYNGQGFGHLQTPQGTQNLPSQSAFLPTKFENVNYSNTNFTNNEQGLGQLQTPQETQNLPSQSGFLSTEFKTFNYPNINYNYNGQRFRLLQTPQGIQYFSSQSGFLPPKFGNVNYLNSNYNYNGQGFGQLQTPQRTQSNPFQFVAQSSELNNFQNSYNYQGLGFGQPLTSQELESLRSQSGLRSSLPTTTNVPSDQRKSFERNYQYSQNDLRGSYSSQYSQIQQPNNRQPVASDSTHIDAQAGSQATGVTSTTSVVNPADWLRLATIPAGYDLVCNPPKGFCWYQPRQQDMKYNVRT